MRGKSRRTQIRQAQLIMQDETFGDIVIAVLRPNCGKINNYQPDFGAYAVAYRLPCGNLREKIHIIKARSSAQNHLGYRQVRAVFDKFLAHPFLFQRPDMLLQPLHQRQIVGNTAH